MKQKFVLVDDEPLIVSAIERLVIDEPFDFYWFNSPVQALEQIEEIAPQVILSDQQMPSMHGIQFLEKVREKLPDTVRMILNGYFLPDNAERALLNGDVSKFISKPWDNATLKKEIRNAFRYVDSTTAPGFVQCDICRTRCSAKHIQVHKSFYLCIRCKKKAEPLTDEVIRLVASFFDGNDGCN